MTGLCVGWHDGQEVQAERPHLCEECRLRVAQRLHALPGFAADLLAADGKATAPRMERTSGSREPVLPGSAVLALLGPASPGDVTLLPDPRPGVVHPREDQDGQQPVHATLTAWALLVVEESPGGLTSLPTPHVSPVWHLRRLTAWLTPHLDWMADQPWADEWDTELRDQWARLRRTAGHEPLVHRLQVPCPACGLRCLVRHDGDDRVVCDRRSTGCGTKWSEETYDALARDVLAAEMERMDERLADEARRSA